MKVHDNSLDVSAPTFALPAVLNSPYPPHPISLARLLRCTHDFRANAPSAPAVIDISAKQGSPRRNRYYKTGFY